MADSRDRAGKACNVLEICSARKSDMVEGAPAGAVWDTGASEYIMIVVMV